MKAFIKFVRLTHDTRYPRARFLELQSNEAWLKEAQSIISRRTRADGGNQLLVKLDDNYNFWANEEVCKQYIGKLIKKFDSKKWLSKFIN
jgi:hypothetical protein